MYDYLIAGAGLFRTAFAQQAKPVGKKVLVIGHRDHRFELGKDENDLPKTIISCEYSFRWKSGEKSYYPVIAEKNGNLYKKYKALADKENSIILDGRLGKYKYYDKDVVIASIFECAKRKLR